MSGIERIQARLTEEEAERLRGIYAPRVVAVPPDDARRSICVMADGEIRAYGSYGHTALGAKGGKNCYIASTDAGLTWKQFDAPADGMGAAVYIPETKQYVTVCSIGGKLFALLSEKGPDDTAPRKIEIGGEGYWDCFQPQRIKKNTRLCITMHHAPSGEYHPAFAYSDDFGESWKIVDLKPTPKYEPIYPSVAPRWENNGAEPVVTELADGKLMLIARTSLDYFYVYYSDDYGENWTDGEKSRFHGTLTTAFLLRMTDGRQLFFWNNTQPLPESNHANHLPPREEGFSSRGGENEFTNRDANHCAVSIDGKNWAGFRELFLNGIRNRADYRTYGGQLCSLDRSVHQFQAVELPFGKVLVAFGQNQVARKMLIFDPDWLLASEREETFIEGMENVSTHLYVRSLSGCFGEKGHCQWNRTNGALLVPNPDMDGTEALQICRTFDPRLYSEKQGVVWNFPMAKKGRVSLSLRIEGEGVRINLCDRWFNPCDDTVSWLSAFFFKLTADTVQPGEWHEIEILFDTEAAMAEVYCDGKKLFGVRQQNAPDYGISYLHLQTDAESADYKGTLIRRMTFSAQ